VSLDVKEEFVQEQGIGGTPQLSSEHFLGNTNGEVGTSLFKKGKKKFCSLPQYIDNR